MSVNLNQFVQQAAVLNDTARVFVSQDGNQVNAQSSLHGLQKISTSARNAETRAAVSEFRAAITNDPRYADVSARLHSQLDAMLPPDKPLTAQGIRNAMLTLDVEKNMDLGKGLVDAGKLPPGHGSSFGQYVVAHSLPVNSPQDLAAAVKDYLLKDVVAQNTASLSKLPNIGPNTATIQNILHKISPPNAQADGVFGAHLEQQLAHGIDSFSFAGLQNAYVNSNQNTIDLLTPLSSEMLNNMTSMDTKNMVQTMKDAQGVIPAESQPKLVMYVMTNLPSIETPAARTACIRDFMVQGAVSQSAQNILDNHGLPESFNSAVGFNPKVDKAIVAMLSQDPGVGVIPSAARVQAATSQCIEDFVTAHEPILRELAIMAEHPPVDLKPPLTTANMARYINTMIAGDAVLEPLLNDTVAIDADFMTKVNDLAEGMNSAAHSLKGDFGADDVASVLDNSIRLLLARRGVSTDDLPGIMEKAIAKFGTAASDLTTLNLATQNGLGGAQRMKYLADGMSAFRALEGFGRALIHIMPREQLVPLGLALPVAPGAGDEAGLQEEGTLHLNFLERTFQKEGDVNALPDYMRSYANQHGLHLAPLDPVVAAQVQQAQVGSLPQSNAQVGSDILKDFIPNPGQANPQNTALFRAVVTTHMESHGLAGLNPELINPRPLFQAMHAAVQAEIDRATAAGEPVNPVVVRQIATDALLAGCVELKSTLTAIDNLPAVPLVQGARVFTPAQREIMKAAVQTTGLRDINVITSLCDNALSNFIDLAMKNMAAPNATGAQLAETASSLGRTFLDVKASLGNANPTDAVRFVTELGMRTANLSPSELQSLQQNLNAPIAQQVAGAFLMAGQLPGMAPNQIETCATFVTVLNEARMAVGVLTGHRAELNRSDNFFSTPIRHLSEIKGGVNGCMKVVNRVARNILPTPAVPLSHHAAQLSPAQWDSMSTLINDVTARMPAGSYNVAVTGQLLANSYKELLGAIETNGGKPLNDGQIWKTLMGTTMPSKAGGAVFGENLHNAMQTKYQGLYRAAVPDISPAELTIMLGRNSTYGVSFQTLLKATQPGAVLVLSDVSMAEELSSLRNYNAKTAYGLTIDFRRRAPESEFGFVGVDGQALTTHPFQIPDEENKPGHPHFQEIIGKVRAMTQSEGQLARVLQMYSQAGTMVPSILSSFFPGVRMGEHGTYSVTSRAQADGSVLVDIFSGPAAPLGFKQQFIVNPDGTHHSTMCEMVRR